MHDDFAQRRRVALAVAITVILVPAAFLLNRDTADPAIEPAATVVGEVLIPGADPEPSGESTERPQATDVMGTSPIGYLDGTVPSNTDDPATIAIPRPTTSLTGSATFNRTIQSSTACQIKDLTTVPFNSSITITNLDNSQSVQCVVSVTGTEPGADVVLNTDAFLQIGDLTDAPLAVEITW